jgi:hypothetical protein
VGLFQPLERPGIAGGAGTDVGREDLRRHRRFHVTHGVLAFEDVYAAEILAGTDVAGMGMMIDDGDSRGV